MEGVVLKYLLDTAPWVNAVTMPGVFPAHIRHILESGETKGLCSISLLETAILHRLGKLRLEGSLMEFFSVGLSANMKLLELTPAIAAKTNGLSEDFQGDPFDRTIVATAAALNMTLVTSDPAIRDARVCSVEFYPFKPSRSKT
jgi:PIN domain nuclease of toxin-antitoxin system